jgi:[protein-PII] uridylyltransferase
VSATATPSRSLSEVRAGVLCRPGLVGVELRLALSDAYDDWLRALVPETAGVALIAVGGLGRGEPAPYSDLDLVLLHDGRVKGLKDLADSIWYPIWDSGIALDHSVRTTDGAVAVAKDDLKAMLGLLEVRHIAGDCALWGPLRARILELWRSTALKRCAELQALSRARWAANGEAAFLLEPNLKDSRGGLRDAQALQALAAAQLVDFPTVVRAAYPVLLDARGELQRRSGRADDVLRLQEHDGVAEALGVLDESGGPRRDAMLRSVNDAARTIAYSLDVAWRRIDAAARAARSPRHRLFGSTAPSGPERIGLARDVVAQDGEVVLSRDAEPRTDVGLVLRAARAAAENGLPLGPFTLERLAAEAAAMPVPWPAHVCDDFVSVLGAGPAAVQVLESLDHAGLLARLLPEWDAVRCKAQYNPVHRFTVDRHLLETAAQAAAFTRQVSRPDLLLLGALLHDIGKGYPGDHSLVGAVHAQRIAQRMGLAPNDVAVVVALTRHHLLLPDTATRRDLNDPVTVTLVSDAVEGSPELLDLLHALTIADAAATGPAAWSEWKAGLIADLVARARAVLDGEPPPAQPLLGDAGRALAEAGQLAVQIRGEEVIVAAPDTVGVLYRTAGVLALHSLDVRSASIHTHAGMAVNTFVVEPRFGRLPDPTLVRSDLARALEGNLGLADRLREKERSYARRSTAALRQAPATVLWFDGAATDATVLEFRAADAIGLLCRVTAALERCAVDVRSARVSSMAGVVVDAFYVTTRDGKPIPTSARPDIETELVRA